VDKCQFSEKTAASIYRVKNYTAHLGKKHGTGTEASGKVIREWLQNLKEVANGISGGGGGEEMERVLLLRLNIFEQFQRGFLLYPETGGRRYFRTVYTYLPNHTASHQIKP
jgi:hypothetical protein